MKPRNLRIEGVQAKGYYQEQMVETVRRYVPKAQVRALLDEFRSEEESVGPAKRKAKRWRQKDVPDVF